MVFVAEFPTLKDFSKKSINNAVIKESLTHPASLFPGVLTILCGLSGALFSSPLLFAASAGTFLTGAVGFIVNFCFRYDSIGRRYLDSLSQGIIDRKADLIKSLQSDLSGCLGIDRDRCQQGITQFSAVDQKYTEIKHLLAAKLSDRELLRQRFVGSVEQVYLSVLDNLREIVGILLGLPDNEEDPRRIRKSNEQEMDEAERRQIAAISKRRQLRLAQLKKVDDLLAKNEEAFTQLEEAAVAISSMRTEEKFSDTGPEESIRQLREIAQRATSMYGRDTDMEPPE
jgi:hypothetical protein